MENVRQYAAIAAVTVAIQGSTSNVILKVPRQFTIGSVLRNSFNDSGSHVLQVVPDDDNNINEDIIISN